MIWFLLRESVIAFSREYGSRVISNGMRPCYALGYDIPNHYEQKYRNGELKMRNTFKDRILTGTARRKNM